MQQGFQHWLLLGWINDNSNRPLAGKRWPMTDIDERTVADYKTYLRVALGSLSGNDIDVVREQNG